MTDHWFWLCIVVACVVWYSTITIVVAIKGAYDIRSMLQSLKTGARTTDTDVQPTDSKITPDSSA